jgi:hypothetical protein
VVTDEKLLFSGDEFIYQSNNPHSSYEQTAVYPNDFKKSIKQFV